MLFADFKNKPAYIKFEFSCLNSIEKITVSQEKRLFSILCMQKHRQKGKNCFYFYYKIKLTFVNKNVVALYFERRTDKGAH